MNFSLQVGNIVAQMPGLAIVNCKLAHSHTLLKIPFFSKTSIDIVNAYMFPISKNAAPPTGAQRKEANRNMNRTNIYL